MSIAKYYQLSAELSHTYIERNTHVSSIDRDLSLCLMKDIENKNQ